MMFCAVRTCGLPKIAAGEMTNLTVRPGERVTFHCKVDLSCLVSTIRWYHEMNNGTEVRGFTKSAFWTALVLLKNIRFT